MSPILTTLIPKFTIFTTKASLFCNSFLEPGSQMIRFNPWSLLAFLKNNRIVAFSKIDQLFHRELTESKLSQFVSKKFHC